MEDLGGYVHEVRTTRDDEVGPARPREGASWSEWHVPKEALDAVS